jgi:hypothetical protein
MDAAARVEAVLSFKREVMVQAPIVSTLLAAIAMTGFVGVLALPGSSKLKSRLLVAYGGSTLLLIFATVVAAMILPPMKAAEGRSSAHVLGLITLSRAAVWSILTGILALIGSIGASGFLHSRRVGAWVLGVAAGTLAAFVVCALHLNAVMHR